MRRRLLMDATAQQRSMHYAHHSVVMLTHAGTDTLNEIPNGFLGNQRSYREGRGLGRKATTEREGCTCLTVLFHQNHHLFLIQGGRQRSNTVAWYIFFSLSAFLHTVRFRELKGQLFFGSAPFTKLTLLRDHCWEEERVRGKKDGLSRHWDNFEESQRKK